MPCHKMMTVKWQDRKPVSIQRTVHGNITLVDTGKTSRETREPVKKTIPILDYDKGLMGRMEQHLVSYILTCCYLKVCKIFLSLFDMMLFNVYVLYKNITSQKLNCNRLRLVVAEELLDGLIMVEYARKGHPAATAPIRLQLACWAHFP